MRLDKERRFLSAGDGLRRLETAFPWGLRRDPQIENLCHIAEEIARPKIWISLRGASRSAGLGDLICSDVHLVHLSTGLRQPQLEALTVH
jgi:hypothetical protein